MFLSKVRVGVGVVSSRARHGPRNAVSTAVQAVAVLCSAAAEEKKNGEQDDGKSDDADGDSDAGFGG